MGALATGRGPGITAGVGVPDSAGDAIAVKGTIALKAAWLGESGAEDE